MSKTKELAKTLINIPVKTIFYENTTFATRLSERDVKQILTVLKEAGLMFASPVFDGINEEIEIE